MPSPFTIFIEPQFREKIVNLETKLNFFFRDYYNGERKNGIFSFAKIECLKKFFYFNCHSPLIISGCVPAYDNIYTVYIYYNNNNNNNN